MKFFLKFKKIENFSKIQKKFWKNSEKYSMMKKMSIFWVCFENFEFCIHCGSFPCAVSISWTCRRTRRTTNCAPCCWPPFTSARRALDSLDTFSVVGNRFIHPSLCFFCHVLNLSVENDERRGRRSVFSPHLKSKSGKLVTFLFPCTHSTATSLCVDVFGFFLVTS